MPPPPPPFALRRGEKGGGQIAAERHPLASGGLTMMGRGGSPGRRGSERPPSPPAIGCTGCRGGGVWTAHTHRDTGRYGGGRGQRGGRGGVESSESKKDHQERAPACCPPPPPLLSVRPPYPVMSIVGAYATRLLPHSPSATHPAAGTTGHSPLRSARVRAGGGGGPRQFCKGWRSWWWRRWRRRWRWLPPTLPLGDRRLHRVTHTCPPAVHARLLCGIVLVAVGKEGAAR